MTSTAIVQKFLDHVFSGAFDEALELVDPAAVFISTNPNPNPNNPMHGTFIGHEGATRFFGGFGETLEPGEFNVTAAFGEGEHAALYGTFRHTMRTTRKEFVSDWALICRVEGGKITFYHIYEDTEAFVKAA